MANAITRHIPNTVTCLNLFSGCIAGVMAFEAKYELAFIFIILSAVFDFFDGMLSPAKNNDTACIFRLHNDPKNKASRHR